MTRYVLRNEGFPYKNIFQARKKVGRVFRHADGTYRGIIGNHNSVASNEEDAFRSVAAQALGYSSPEELRDHNRVVRAQRRVERQHLENVFNRFMSASNKDERFAALDVLFGRK